jgi:transposase
MPDEETEAARDPVRAREDVRGDLRSTRHRVMHLPLRRGIVSAGGAAWPGVDENWLGSQRFPRPALQWS